MSAIENARELRNKVVLNHPDLSDEVSELFSLMLTEISDGESTDNEVSLFINSVEELLEENGKTM